LIIAYLSLGTNLGNKVENLKNALHHISLFSAIKKVSSVYETEPWGYQSNNSFYNICIEIETLLEAHTLLENLLSIESHLGRSRSLHYTDRIIDIDILLYNNMQIETDNLKVPHPHLHKRNFVLNPLVQIAADVIHPIFKISIQELYSQSEDSNKITQLPINDLWQ
jgi:2-amino-4-hydroxy-6-hydroxymethyldihydropteridine diphosphokinase